jgi:hypothetical protein
MLNSYIAMILEKTSPSIMHVQNGYNIKLNFSGPRTLQRNGKMKWKFQTFFGRIRSILNNAGLEEGIRYGARAECARTTTFLSNITSIKAK